MKKPTLHIISALMAALILCLSTGEVYAQNGGCSNPTFEFDFDGANANCTISCGKIINEAIWKVGGDTCTNTSDTIWLDPVQCTGPTNVSEVNITIDREGNQVTNDDFIIVDIYCGASLVSTDTTWGLWPPSSGNSNVRTNTYYVNCSYPDFMIIQVIIGSDDQNAKLKQLSGGSCMNCFDQSLLPVLLSNEKLSASVNEVYYSFDVELEGINQELSEAKITLQKSADGKTFQKANASQKSINGKRVTLTDRGPDKEFPYYRAKVNVEGESTQFTRVLHWDSDNYEQIKLHPNPVKSGKSINIESPSAINMVEIRDLTGKVLFSEKVNHSPTSLNIPLDEVKEAGIYFVTVSTQNRTESVRFIAD